METQENRDEIPGTTPPSWSEDIFDENKFSDIQIDYLLRTRTY